MGCPVATRSIRPGTRVLNQFQLGRALTGELGLDPPIKALFVYNSNPVTQSCDQGRTLSGLAHDDLFTVVSEQYLTDTADYADIILPATTQLEQFDIMFSWGHLCLSLNLPAIEPLGEAVPNVEQFRPHLATHGCPALALRFSRRPADLALGVGSVAVLLQEEPHLAVEPLSAFDAAEVSDAGQDDQARPGNASVQSLAHVDGRADVLVAVEEEGWHIDSRKDVSEIGLGHRLQHCLVRGRANTSHEGPHLLDHLRRGRLGEQPRQVAGNPLLRCPLHVGGQADDPPAHFVGREGPGPSGIGAGQDEGPGNRGMPVEQL